jgi:hypothetical protein
MAAGVEGVVRIDRRAREHEPHPAVRQVEADGHLGVALVRAVAEPEEAADPGPGVERVEIHGLVERLLLLERVHVLIGRCGPEPGRIRVHTH